RRGGLPEGPRRVPRQRRGHQAGRPGGAAPPGSLRRAVWRLTGCVSCPGEPGGGGPVGEDGLSRRRGPGGGGGRRGGAGGGAPGGLEAGRKAARRAEQLVQDWNRLKAQEAVAVETIARLERDLPRDRAGARREHAELVASRDGLFRSIDAARVQLAKEEKE